MSYQKHHYMKLKKRKINSLKSLGAYRVDYMESSITLNVAPLFSEQGNDNLRKQYIIIMGTIIIEQVIIRFYYHLVKAVQRHENSVQQSRESAFCMGVTVGSDNP
jgi:thiamine transporter ThiT